MPRPSEEVSCNKNTPPGPAGPAVICGDFLNSTGNFQLNQWDPEDRILRTDFNEDNAKLDAALKSQAEALAAETAAREQADAAFGNCKMQYGTYVGTGTYGDSNPTRLTFSFEPKLVIIQMLDEARTDDKSCPMMVLVRPLMAFAFSKGVYRTPITWSGNSVSWTGWDASYQFNSSGATYLYIAFG